jgi:hypothetical protein
MHQKEEREWGFSAKLVVKAIAGLVEINIRVGNDGEK